MSDFFASVELIGLNRLVARLNAPRVPGAIAATIREETAILEDTVRQRMAALFHNPSKMQAAVKSEVVNTPLVSEGTVYAEGLPYLRIQEYGGVTRPHDILPVHGKVLAFMAPAGLGFKGSAGNEMIFTKRVHHPGSRVPERSYMRSALAMRRAAIIAALQGSTITAMAAE